MLVKRPSKAQGPADPRNIYDRALALARELEALLEAAHGAATGREAHGLRMSEAMLRSLMTELDELRRTHGVS